MLGDGFIDGTHDEAPLAIANVKVPVFYIIPREKTVKSIHYTWILASRCARLRSDPRFLWTAASMHIVFKIGRYRTASSLVLLQHYSLHFYNNPKFRSWNTKNANNKYYSTIPFQIINFHGSELKPALFKGWQWQTWKLFIWKSIVMIFRASPNWWA